MKPLDIEAIEKLVYFARKECNVSIGLIKERVLPICDGVESLVKRIRELEVNVNERPIFDDADILVIERTASRHPEDGWVKCWKRIRPLIDWATKGDE